MDWAEWFTGRTWNTALVQYPPPPFCMTDFVVHRRTGNRRPHQVSMLPRFLTTRLTEFPRLFPSGGKDRYQGLLGIRFYRGSAPPCCHHRGDLDGWGRGYALCVVYIMGRLHSDFLVFHRGGLRSDDLFDMRILDKPCRPLLMKGSWPSWVMKQRFLNSNSYKNNVNSSNTCCKKHFMSWDWVIYLIDWLMTYSFWHRWRPFRRKVTNGVITLHGDLRVNAIMRACPIPRPLFISTTQYWLANNFLPVKIYNWLARGLRVAGEDCLFSWSTCTFSLGSPFYYTGTLQQRRNSQLYNFT